MFKLAKPAWLEEVASTNDELKLRVASGAARPGDVLAARRQTRGRGRMDAVWESARDGDLTFSFYWRGRVAPAVLGSLAMAAALGVGDFLAGHGVDARCKWPNDVMAGDAKICGILAEGGQTSDGNYDLVVGIGVNLRRVPGREDRFARPIAALEDFIPDVPAPDRLLPALLAHLETRIQTWESGGFAALRPDLLARFWGMGRPVSARTATGRVEGIVVGLGDCGELRVRLPDSTETSVASVSALDGWEEKDTTGSKE